MIARAVLLAVLSGGCAAAAPASPGPLTPPAETGRVVHAESLTPFRLEGLDTTTLRWSIDGTSKQLAFEQVVVDVDAHPHVPFVLVYLGQDSGTGRLAADQVALLDLRTSGFRMIGSVDGPTEWPETGWSPGGTRLVALEDRYGPFVVLEVADASAWIAGNDDPQRHFRADHYEPHMNHPGKIHIFEGWISERAFEFSGACCGNSIRYIADVVGKHVTPADDS